MTRLFEFDPVKSQSNKRKHGIDFVEAQALWLGVYLEVDARSTTENRAAIIGPIHGMFWTAFFTQREDRIRIISVRRSRNEEKSAYEKNAKINHR